MITRLFGWRSALAGAMLATIAAIPAQAKPSAAPPGQVKRAAQAAQTSGTAAHGAIPSSKVTGGSPKKGLGAVNTASCTNVPFVQPFTSFGDFHWYTLMPGQGVDDFAGNGWTLSGGASLGDVALADGTSGPVLNLPSGSSAVSPPMCVSSDYPAGRTMIRDTRGSSGVQFYVSYEGTHSWNKPRHTGLIHGDSTAWTLSPRFNLQPYNTTGWQIVRFRLAVGRHGGDYQLYNLYVDPNMRK